LTEKLEFEAFNSDFAVIVVALYTHLNGLTRVVLIPVESNFGNGALTSKTHHATYFFSDLVPVINGGRLLNWRENFYCARASKHTDFLELLWEPSIDDESRDEVRCELGTHRVLYEELVVVFNHSKRVRKPSWQD
jgi:hypothetical protein